MKAADVKALSADQLNEELAKLAQVAENEYVGVNCGIMDQMASAMGKSGCAMFLDQAPCGLHDLWRAGFLASPPCHPADLRITHPLVHPLPAGRRCLTAC